MDSVRFGRALGFGARAAAKTLVTAMDAATAPNPSATTTGKSGEERAARPASTASATGAGSGAQAAGSGVPLSRKAARTTAQVLQTGQGLKEGGRRFGAAMGGRVGRLSAALWLELTGVFFGIFALSAAGGAWKVRAAFHETATNHDAHSRFLVAVLMAVVFGYFCVSSFVKANRRTRGH